MSVLPDASSLRKMLCVLKMTKPKLFLRECSASEFYNTTLALWKGQKQTHPWHTLHFACRSLQVPSFLKHQCWACPKVCLSHGFSLWATSAGNIQPFAAQKLWVMQHKYWNIRPHSQSTREDWTPVLSITHRSSYFNKFQEITIIHSSSWHCKQNI